MRSLKYSCEHVDVPIDPKSENSSQFEAARIKPSTSWRHACVSKGESCRTRGPFKLIERKHSTTQLEWTMPNSFVRHLGRVDLQELIHCH